MFILWNKAGSRWKRITYPYGLISRLHFPISGNQISDIGKSTDLPISVNQKGFSILVNRINDIKKIEFPISGNDLPISENTMIYRYREIISRYREIDLPTSVICITFIGKYTLNVHLTPLIVQRAFILVYKRVEWAIVVTFADIDVPVCRRSFCGVKRYFKVHTIVTYSKVVPLNVMSYVHFTCS